MIRDRLRRHRTIKVRASSFLFVAGGEHLAGTGRLSVLLTTAAAIILSGLALALALSSPAQTQAQVITPPPLENSPYDRQVFQIADGLQCPVCQGQTVAYSNSGLAQQMRALIKKKLEQGENETQINQYFVERYGEGILTTPPKSGFTLLVWLLPVAGVLLGSGLVGYTLRSWKGRGYRERLQAQLPENSAAIAPVEREQLPLAVTALYSEAEIPTPHHSEVLLSPAERRVYEARVERDLQQAGGLKTPPGPAGRQVEQPRGRGRRAKPARPRKERLN